MTWQRTRGSPRAIWTASARARRPPWSPRWWKGTRRTVFGRPSRVINAMSGPDGGGSKCERAVCCGNGGDVTRAWCGAGRRGAAHHQVCHPCRASAPQLRPPVQRPRCGQVKALQQGLCSQGGQARGAHEVGLSRALGAPAVDAAGQEDAPACRHLLFKSGAQRRGVALHPPGRHLVRKGLRQGGLRDHTAARAGVVHA